MFNSLYAKLAAVLTGLFCIVGLFFVGAAVFSSRLYQQEVNQRLNRNLAGQILAEKPLIQDRQVNRKALKEIFHVLMIINPGIEVYLLDAEGNILAFSAPEGKVKRKSVDTGPIMAWLSGDARLPVFGDDPKNPTGKKVFSVARIPEHGATQGYLYVILGGEFYDSVAKTLQGSHILRLSAWMVFAGMLFALVAGLILFAVLTSRLRKLSNQVDEFNRGEDSTKPDAELKIHKKPSDEISRLSEAFENMSLRIEEQMKRLRESDALRRELIANVSHDLRTPLSTLRSYIETLLIKDAMISENERREYLETAVKHCERLSRLISELMELAKYESFEIEPRPEAFNLAELISDVAQKFQIEAKQRGIEINLNIAKRLPFVFADIAMIERVLENLVENAIHYTPAGGKVDLDLTCENNSVRVRVKDTGKGIAPEDVPRIFERFYRSGKNRPANTFHSGLGLAISHRILRLHDRDITVESQPGSGASFSFSLEGHGK